MYFSSLISKLKVTCMSIVPSRLSLFSVNSFFLVLKSWYTDALCHPNMGSERRIVKKKNRRILIKKNVLLKLNFQNKGHLYTNSLFHILSFCLRCLFLQFLSRGFFTLLEQFYKIKFRHSVK